DGGRSNRKEWAKRTRAGARGKRVRLGARGSWRTGVYEVTTNENRNDSHQYRSRQGRLLLPGSSRARRRRGFERADDSLHRGCKGGSGLGARFSSPRFEDILRNRSPRIGRVKNSRTSTLIRSVIICPRAPNRSAAGKKYRTTLNEPSNDSESPSRNENSSQALKPSSTA